MSTKMYNYRIPKDQWWSFFLALREHYLTEHPMMQILSNYVAKNPPWKEFRVVLAEFTGNQDEDWTARLQLFDEGDETGTFLIRPLERGYFFLNLHDQEPWPSYGLKPVFYDNRTDVPPEEEGNKEIAEWVDEQIELHCYFLVDLLTRNDYERLSWKTKINQG